MIIITILSIIIIIIITSVINDNPRATLSERQDLSEGLPEYYGKGNGRQGV